MNGSHGMICHKPKNKDNSLSLKITEKKKKMGSFENVSELPQEKPEEVYELLKAETHFWKHHYSFMIAASLECAVHLGIPDAIHKNGNQPITLSQLISSLPIHPSKSSHVYRLLRILVNAGFVIESGDIYTTQNSDDPEKVGFSLTAAGRLLLKDGPQMANAMLPLVFCTSLLKPWSHLSEWFRNDDETPFETAHGKKFWTYFGEDPSLRKLFNDAMAGESEFTAKLLTGRCRFTFEGLKSLVDVGGGTGTTSRAIANKFPSLKCCVYDLPHVVGNEKGTKNLDFVGGSMFDEIPQANAILLKWILHNWKDEDCIKILKNCKKAIPSKEHGGKVIIIDIVMLNPDASDHDTLVTQNCFDMEMLIMFDSKERTEKDFAALFEKSGFSGYKIFPLLGFRSLIEVYP